MNEEVDYIPFLVNKKVDHTPFSLLHCSLQVLVVGNPANTNCLLTAKMAPSIPPANFTCLTRLDQNRAVAQVMSSGHVHVAVVHVVLVTDAAATVPRLLRKSRSPMTLWQTSSYGGTTPPPSFRTLLTVTWTVAVRRSLCTMR